MIEYKQPTNSKSAEIALRDRELRRVVQGVDSILTEYNDYFAELKKSIEALGETVPDVPRR